MNYSITYIGLIVAALATFLPKIGVTIGTAELTNFVQVLIQLIGGVVVLYGRYRLGGINALGVKGVK